MNKDMYSRTNELSKIDEDCNVMNKNVLFVTIRSILICIAAVNLWSGCRMEESLLKSWYEIFWLRF